MTGKRAAVTVRLSEATVEAMDAVRGSLGRAAWVESVVEAALRHTGTLTARTSRESGICPPHPKGRVIKGFCYRCGKPAA